MRLDGMEFKKISLFVIIMSVAVGQYRIQDT